MVSTRAMAARKAPATNQEEENETLTLRKKPLRRATAKTAATSTTTTAKSTKRTAATTVEPTPPKASPLSPKKITQVAKAKAVETPAEVKKPAPKTRSTAATVSTAKKAEAAAATTTRPKRLLRGAAATTAAAAASAPSKPEPRAPVTRRKAALPPAARGKSARTRKTKAKSGQTPEPEAETEAGVEAEVEAEATPDAELDDNESEAEPVEEDEQVEDHPVEQEQEQEQENEDEDEDEDGSEQEDEATEEPVSIQPTPKGRTQRHQEPEDEADDESEDELCGPNTPMRRPLTPAREGSFYTSARKLHTPARRLVVHRAHRGTPQTQRVPLKPAAPSSPQRPMTVSRGANKMFVFRPLKKLSQSPKRSPAKTPSENNHQHIVQDSELDSDSSSDELQRFVHHETNDIQPSPVRSVNAVAEDSGSEDELAGPGPSTESSEDEAEDDTIVDEDDNGNETDYEHVEPDLADEVSDASYSVIDGSDVDDSILPEPQLSADLLQSSPDSVSVNDVQADIEDSELLSSPAPSTPASVIRRNLGEEDSPTDQIAPAPRLSLSAHEPPSELISEGEATPNYKPRVSFSTATAKMLQTPRMQFALGGAETPDIESTPSVHFDDAMDIDIEKTITINPSLLGVDVDGVELSAKLENAAAIPTPFFKIPTHDRLSMGLSNEGRMTLLEDDIMNLVDLDYSSPAKPQVETPATEAEPVLPESHDMRTPRRTPHHKSRLSTPRPEVTEQISIRQVVDVPPTPPSYARSTFAFDARRNSLPAFGASTPDASFNRPRTAETTIKPSTSDMFMKLWASKQRRLSARNSISGTTTPQMSGVQTPVLEPLSVQKRDSTPLQRSASVIQIQEHPASPSTFSGPKLRKHTPTSALKPSRSSPRKRYESPRTPMKTPLKAPGATPAPIAMTPHPSAPLHGILALVEVFTLDGSSASSPFIALLQRLGARTTKTFSDKITHVVFKDGSPTTLQKIRVANKDRVAGGGGEIFCVNSRWVTDCEREGRRMDETDEVYMVDLQEVNRGRRRRKSMEPAALKNIDGNILGGSGGGSGERSRKQSLGRKSMASRVSIASSFWGGEDSPVKGTPARKGWQDDHDDDDEDVDAFFDEPTKGFEIPAVGGGGIGGLTDMNTAQMTAPVKRVQKLRLRDEDQGRRLTFLSGRE